MKTHKLAAYFPILEGEEFDLLVEDIKKNGQIEPIITYLGEVLDGWNRYRACEVLGIDPLTKEYDGDDPLSYVISANIRRRHMDVSQRAMLATEMLPEFEREAKERKEAIRDIDTGSFMPSGSEDPGGGWLDWHRSRDDAAKVFGVSGPTVQRAKRIKEEAPERVADIIKGKATVTGVDTELRMAEAKRLSELDRDKAMTKHIKQRPKIVADYFDAIKAYRMTLTIAIAAAKEQQMFSAESINMLKTKHSELRNLMDELEENV